MPRVGLTQERVVAAAARLLDTHPASQPTLGRIARELGVKTPSLYNHVDGIDALMRLVSLDAIDRLADVLRGSVMGRSGSDALFALADAYRKFAVAHPGTYPLTQVARPGDVRFEESAARAVEPVVAFLAGSGLTGDDLVHAARTVRSALHGFSLLATSAGFALDVEVDASFEWLVAAIDAGVRGMTVAARP